MSFLAYTAGGDMNVTKLLRNVAILPIRFYKCCISPMLPNRCRFYPSCSNYAMEAILTHGILKGGLLASSRILRCHPWHEGGIDPVPPPGKQLAE